MALIDFHAHVEPTPAAVRRILEKMDRLRISRAAVVCGRVAPPQVLSRNITEGTGGNHPVPNARLRELCATTGGRLLPFYFANPYENADEYRATGGHYYGLKLGPAIHGVALTDPRNTAYVEVARELGHVVYLHCLARPGFAHAALVTLAETYPDVRFVLGHAGIGNCDFSAVDAIRPRPNIYYETSGGFAGVIRYALDELGPGRLLFGSEYPLQDPAVEIVKMRVVGLAARALNANARGLLKLEARHA